MNMNDSYRAGSHVGEDHPVGGVSPGRSLQQEIGGYLLGLALAAALTAVSFWATGTRSIYGPGVALALLVLAVAQMGIHLVFFLHITTAPDNSNNVLALAFGVLIVCLIVFGSVWVMNHLNHQMMSVSALVKLQT
ncbi:MAG TPA: cytochrome o ubiquinol oxidase subunit IV [Steroidobacteraceae bacterium]|nr:cytochrome o ubiquinol oxidase subunit IV [Steroidobacteraceae bacterium]